MAAVVKQNKSKYSVRVENRCRNACVQDFSISHESPSDLGKELVHGLGAELAASYPKIGIAVPVLVLGQLELSS